jgi:hypothetical protein
MSLYTATAVTTNFFSNQGSPISITDNGNTSECLRTVQKDKETERYGSYGDKPLQLGTTWGH